MIREPRSRATVGMTHPSRRPLALFLVPVIVLAVSACAVMAPGPAARSPDLAAPALIVQEAGGRFTDISGRLDLNSGTAIFSNGHLHDELLRIVAGM